MARSPFCAPVDERGSSLCLLPPATIARRMNRLEADGFRQFGIAGLPDSVMGPIFPSLSLRWQPQLR